MSTDGRLRREGRNTAFAGATAEDASSLCRYNDSRKRTLWLEAFMSETKNLDAEQEAKNEYETARRFWASVTLENMDAAEAIGGLEGAERSMLEAIYDLVKGAE